MNKIEHDNIGTTIEMFALRSAFVKAIFAKISKQTCARKSSKPNSLLKEKLLNFTATTIYTGIEKANIYALTFAVVSFFDIFFTNVFLVASQTALSKEKLIHKFILALI